MNSDLTIRKAITEEDILKVMVVRGIVFIEEQDVDWEGEIDEFETQSIHFLGQCAGQPVAAGRLRILESGEAKLERIAVRQRWRGKGFARQMMQALLDETRPLGVVKLKLHAQVYLEDFYASFGFQRQGGIFRECEIDHILMTREDG
ncbi:MAG: GNAT family N-acetyltransferase [bacterium]|nr:GNAT family N-acetyltransferase [bacterium]